MGPQTSSRAKTVPNSDNPAADHGAGRGEPAPPTGDKAAALTRLRRIHSMNLHAPPAEVFSANGRSSLLTERSVP